MVEANRLADKEDDDDAEGHRKQYETPDPDAEDRKILGNAAAAEEEDDAEGHQKMH